MNRFKTVAVLFAFAALCFAAGTVYHIVSSGEGIVSSICLALGCACLSYVFFRMKK